MNENRQTKIVEVEPAQPPPPLSPTEGPRDLTPISWGGTEDDYTDFRPVQIPSETPDPKDLSAAVSADFSETAADLIPTVSDTGSSLSDDLAQTASAAKASMPVRVPEPLKRHSSPSPKAG